MFIIKNVYYNMKIPFRILKSIKIFNIYLVDYRYICSFGWFFLEVLISEFADFIDLQNFKHFKIVQPL